MKIIITKEVDIQGVTLLSVEDTKNLPLYWLKCNDHWWLKSPGITDNKAMFVDGEYGRIMERGCNVDHAFGVRPALKISTNLKIRDKFEFGEETFTIIADNLALCNRCINEMAFNKISFNKGKPNDYESSYIKQNLEEWFDCAKLLTQAKELEEEERE